MNLSLTDEVVLVTGASRGIGAAIAQTFADAGARVIGTATSADGAAKIDAALGERGRGAVLDVRDGEAIDALIKAIEAREGAISVLVNNAGLTRDQLLLRMKDDDWDDALAANLKGVFRLSKAVLRGMMKARHGRILSLGSVVGSTGNPGQANYAAAKAGLIGFSKSLAREVGSRNITVNVIAPGFIDTDMTQALKPEQRDAMTQNIPLARLGTAQDIAVAALFLASRQAGYITGETLHVNGGMYMA
jgi:3-oxoacyl-[acyl-carrier protein] reductase